MELYSFILLFGVGLLAGMINVGAGGGSSLTLPVLIFLGLDSALANGTNRIALIVQNIFAIYGFEQEKQNEFKRSIQYALFTLPGAAIGAVAAIHISDVLFQRILAVVMVLIVATMFLPKMRENHISPSNKKSWIIYMALVGVGFYGGFIQVGVGFLIMATLFHLGGLSLIKVNVHKVFMVLFYTIPTLIIFTLSDHVNWSYGITLAAGHGLGGWLSARISVKKGEGYIRIILAIAIMLMAYKLLSFGVDQK